MNFDGVLKDDVVETSLLAVRFEASLRRLRAAEEKGGKEAAEEEARKICMEGVTEMGERLAAELTACGRSAKFLRACLDNDGNAAMFIGTDKGTLQIPFRMPTLDNCDEFLPFMSPRLKRVVLDVLKRG